MAEIAMGNWFWRKWRRAVQLYAPSSAKRSQWNREFSTGRWNCLTATPGDPVYAFLEKYAAGQSILDLGCGSGNTASELAPHCYRNYIGVDISDEAVAMAAKRAEENGRADKNRFFQSDIQSYVPAGKFRIILFRDSIYYVPGSKLKGTLQRYAQYLEPGGVFVVRMYDAGAKLTSALRVIERDFEVVEKQTFDRPWAMVIVFR